MAANQREEYGLPQCIWGRRLRRPTQIKYLRVPDEIIDIAKDQQQYNPQGGFRGRGGGGGGASRGDHGGRGGGGNDRGGRGGPRGGRGRGRGRGS